MEDAVTGPRSAVARQQRLGAEERRRQIVEATIACLARAGPERWTLRQVSRDLGVAPSLVTHFFHSWDELVIAAYRALAERFEREFAEIARRPGMTARARLDLYVERYFAPRWTGEEIAGAYIAFWALGRSQPRLRAEMDRFSEAMRGSLNPLVVECAEERGIGAAEQTFETFYFLLSGLWYETAVNPGSVRDPGPADRARAFLDFALAER